MCCAKTLFWPIIVVVVCSGVIQFAEPAQLRCYLGSFDQHITKSMANAIDLIDSPCIDLEKPTVIYTFGYRGKVNGPATTAVISGYIATKKRNVILLDWETEAKSGLLGIPLGYALSAVPNAKKIGDEFGQTLVTLARAGLNMTQVHLIGHSLGAHLMCYAGRAARKRGYTVERLTALDAARALFGGTLAINRGVDRTCAKSVMVIHSDPDEYGIADRAGTVDFYPNYAGPCQDTNQPGCKPGQYKKFSPEDLCDHDRSWRFLVESLENRTSFVAVAADSYDNWVAGKFNVNNTAFMGDITSSKARGTFYLTTNASPPYAKGEEGIYFVDQKKRRRRNPTVRGFGTFLRSLR